MPLWSLMRKYNESLAAWIEQNEIEHWAMSKFPKKRWDKMTTDLEESFNSWLRNERHHSICSFIIEHMANLGAMLVKHKAESNAWKGIIGLKIEEKVKINIAKWEVYSVSLFMETFYAVFVGDLVLNVDIKEQSCTCRGWKMSGIPCDHACSVLLSIRQNVVDFVDEIFKSSNPQHNNWYTQALFMVLRHMTC